MTAETSSWAALFERADAAPRTIEEIGAALDDRRRGEDDERA